MRRFLDRIEEWNPATEPLLSVLGPTGSGKTSTVLRYAKTHLSKVKPLLVSVDAVAFYRGLDIGSAKPQGVERDHDWTGLDFLDPIERATTMGFIRSVAPHIAKARSENRPIIVVGGSHFYERALVEGIGPGADSDPAYLRSLETVSNLDLHKQLVAKDARWATKVYAQDRYRLLRYSDVTLRQGHSFDAIFGPTKLVPPLEGLWKAVPTLILGDSERTPEYEAKLRARIQEMLDLGFVNEVSNLLSQGVPDNAPALQSVGYREVLSFIQGELPRDSLLEAILISHLRLGKKQRTWLRGLKNNVSRSS